MQRDFQALEKRRLAAVKLFSKELNNSEISRLLQVCNQTVCRWRKQYAAGGKSALEKVGRAGRKPLVGGDDQQRLVELLQQGPERWGFETRNAFLCVLGRGSRLGPRAISEHAETADFGALVTLWLVLFAPYKKRPGPTIHLGGLGILTNFRTFLEGLSPAAPEVEYGCSIQVHPRRADARNRRLSGGMCRCSRRAWLGRCQRAPHSTRSFFEGCSRRNSEPLAPRCCEITDLPRSQDCQEVLMSE